MKKISNKFNISSKSKICEFVAMGSDLKLNNEKLNHRFRTVFTNDNKESFFIEFGIHQVSKYCIKSQKDFIGQYIFRIDHLFRLNSEEFNTNSRDPKYAEYERIFFKVASKKAVLDFLNQELNCNFEDINISNKFNIDYGQNRTEYKLIKLGA